MARQRKGNSNNASDGVPVGKSDKAAGNSSSSGGSVASKGSSGDGILSYWKVTLGCVCLVIAAVVGYMGYLETRVNTPYDDHKMVIKTGLDVPERYWGSYRPGTYFGLKTRDPYSLVTGLMWYFPRRLSPGGDGIRHWCEQGDNLQRYGWLQHDGSSFGLQEIQDGPFLLTTSFVKQPGGHHGGDWTARITVTPQNPAVQSEEVSLIWYIATEEKTGGWIKPSTVASKLITGMRGETPGLGSFTIKLFNYSGTIQHESYLSTVSPGLHRLRETVISSLRLSQEKSGAPKRIVLAGELLSGVDGSRMEPNLIATQVTVKLPFSLDVAFESGSFVQRDEILAAEKYSEALAWHQNRFQQRFEDTFHLKTKGYSSDEIAFSQAAFSNLVGGIGYFYGSSRVQSSYTKEPVPYWRAPLYTSVPSRSFFPRGFLWDEGFHGLVIAAWDLDLELDIMSHWFDLMNVEGWIPREQILGVEALAKVPEEFVTQRNSNANPPTFFLTLRYILNRYSDQLMEGGSLATLERLYPRLQAWFAWFNTTQRGEISGSYRWRGRDSKTSRELNPKTLTSGFDDYPRASHPTINERHIDLRCWIAMAAETINDIGRLLNRDTYKYTETFLYLTDNMLLNELHWSPFTETYSDYGLHTDSVILKRPKSPARSHGPPIPTPEKVRFTLKDPELRFVDTTFGYVSLFPFLLQILEVDSPKLGKVLSDLRKPDLLWTEYGLRSLAKTSPLYMKRNTEHDPPYWRGPIWININFLAVRALHYYGSNDGPFREKAAQLAKELKDILINNIMKEYYRTGYIWEQYNDKTGEGQGCRPFTGWSALVVLLMAEHY